jgi:heptosyltransferase III
MENNNKDVKPKIAYLPARQLGDGLLMLIVANNLQKNGYSVTYYSKILASLDEWLPNITIKPPCELEDLDKLFVRYDLAMADSITFTEHPDSFCQKLSEKCVFYYLGGRGKRESMNFKGQKQLQGKITNKDKLAKILVLTKANTIALSKISKTLPFAETITLLCKNVLGFNNATKDIGLVMPETLQHRKHKKRVVIHPTSGNNDKNWSAHKFIKLARKLRKKNWEPVFIVGPHEYKEWTNRIKKEFLLPQLPKIKELAAFIFESDFMIGNDSGIGHLASCLNIPTLTILNSPHTKGYRWRPGWGYGLTINSPINFKLIKKRCWQWFISVKKVLTAFDKLVRNSQ